MRSPVIQRLCRYRSRLQLSEMPGFVHAAGGVLPPVSILPREEERGRIYSTVTTFWLFLYQVLSGNCSLETMVTKAIGWLQPHHSKPISHNTSGYSQARSRFPRAVLDQFHQALALHSDPSPDFHGFRTKVVDGTGLLVEDTPENRETFPPHPKKGSSPDFPALKLLPIFSLGSGVVLRWTIGRITEADCTLFRQLWPFLVSGDLILGDRHFCSYASYALLLKRGVQSVSRLHQRRTKVRVVKNIGPGDRIVEWAKPEKKPEWISTDDWESIPEVLRVREISFQVEIEGFRTEHITIVTTILEENIPASDWAELFRKRWHAELNLRDIKTTMQMEFIRAKSPKMVEKEVGFFLLAYDLVRMIMEKASEERGVPLEKLSFKATVTAINTYSPLLAHARTKAEYEWAWSELLRCVGYPRLRNRKNRVEPRARKRRPKTYQLLMEDRHQFTEIRHRNRYKKNA